MTGETSPLLYVITILIVELVRIDFPFNITLFKEIFIYWYC